MAFLRGPKCDQKLIPFHSITKNSNRVDQLKRDDFCPINKIDMKRRRALAFDPVHKPGKPLRGYRWLPSDKIRRDDERPWTLFCDYLLAWDVQQNKLGDCWVLAALVAILHVRPDLVRQMVTGPELINGKSVYKVRLFYDGRPVVVYVSDHFPVDTNDRLVFGQARKSQLFVSLIEKAYAFVIHCYEALNGGAPIDVLSTFTGYPARKIDLTSVDSRDSNVDQLWNTMLGHKQNGFALVASTGNHPTVTELEYKNKGLLNDHAYAMLDLLSLTGLDGKPVRLVRLHTSTDTPTWTGPFSDNLWPGQLLYRLMDLPNYQLLMPDKESCGVFWMTFQDFAYYFERVDVGLLLDRQPMAYLEHRFDALFPRWGDEQRYHSVYKITVPQLTKKLLKQNVQQQLTTLYISAYQNSHRSKPSRDRPKYCFGLAVFELEDLEKKVTGDLIVYSGLTDALHQECDLQVKPGSHYLVALVNFDDWPLPNEPPNTMEDSNVANEKYVLTFHSSRAITVESYCCPMSLQGNVLFEIVKEHGDVDTVADGMGRVYTLSGGECFVGFVMAVENRSEDKSLQCSLTYEPKLAKMNVETNIRVTRGSNSTNDVVPPYSWQILFVALPYSTTINYEIDSKWLTPKFDLLPNDAPELHEPDLGRNASIHSVRKITYDLSD